MAIKKIFWVAAFLAVVFSSTPAVSAQSMQAQTSPATNITNYQATFNGYFSSSNYYGSSNVYFQWGTTSGYGNQTQVQSLSSAGTFSHTISGLTPNTTYHFRAVAQDSYGTAYGQNMTFDTLGYNGGTTNNFLVAKKAINLTRGALSWSNYVNANPGDILSFAVTIQAGNQNLNNVVVRDILPANLIYRGNLTVNTTANYSGDLASGINIGTVYANQPAVVSYQAQVAPGIGYGTFTLTNNATVTTNQTGTQTASATISVTNTAIQGSGTGPTDIPTGSAGNFWMESFLLPLSLIILGAWLYLSGITYNFADWLKRIRNKT